MKVKPRQRPNTPRADKEIDEIRTMIQYHVKNGMVLQYKGKKEGEGEGHITNTKFDHHITTSC